MEAIKIILVSPHVGLYSPNAALKQDSMVLETK